jgi:hypothetical protein
MASWSNTWCYAMLNGNLKDDLTTVRGSEMFEDDHPKIPREQLISTRPIVGWTPPFSRCLMNITMNDKLVIFAHGDAAEIFREGYGPDDLAAELYNCGLRNVGIITFKGCSLGNENFLEYFRSACDNVKGGIPPGRINVGFLKAYKGAVRFIDGRYKVAVAAGVEKRKMILGNASGLVPNNLMNEVYQKRSDILTI